MMSVDCRMRGAIAALAIVVMFVMASAAQSQVCNVKVVTDANPDCSDMDSLIRSATAKWSTPEQKCWAMFYWTHIARRQTSPMIVHGLEVTDPIRQFNDYGYTMCSTVSGINCGIWHHMGMDVRLWDITLHTVSECFYGDRWHIYDNSMSAMYTLCDGVTIAGVEDVGQEGACAASGGKREPGHIAKYHCLTATSANGFLTGADCPRDLAQEYRCFNPNSLKHRVYYHNWDGGHRYQLNLREHETYTRYYHSLGTDPAYYIPNDGKDPEAVNERYHIRGNGVWTFQPLLTAESLARAASQAVNLEILPAGGVHPAKSAEPAEVVFKIASANVAASQKIHVELVRKSHADAASIAISTTNGLTWREVWRADDTGDVAADMALLEPVSGAYEILVKVVLEASATPQDVVLKSLKIETTTMLNSKTQPRLRLGKNRIYVGAGDQTDSIVLWPELQGGKYRPCVVAENNITTRDVHPGYQGVLHASRPNEPAFVVYRIDAPRDIRRIVYGGRFYNRAPKSEIWLSHSFDQGTTWSESYRLADTNPPWDVIHYVTIDAVPPGCRSVLLKYGLQSSAVGSDACSIYGVRMEAQHDPQDPGVRPLEVSFDWSEVQPDRTLTRRSHTQRIDTFPAEYVINVGGADHPLVNALTVKLADAASDVQYGYSDGVDAGGEKSIDRWVTYGPNLLEGKPYTLSIPPTGQWGGDDPAHKKLTDGIVGPNYAGGIVPTFGPIWDATKGRAEVTVDIGTPAEIGAFRIHVTAGWPWWDALRGEVLDDIEVLTSMDGQDFRSHGKFNLNLWHKDIPINHLLTDDETAQGWNYDHILDVPVSARFVRYRIEPHRALCITEVQALKFISYEPFDLRVALPSD